MRRSRITIQLRLCHRPRRTVVQTRNLPTQRGRERPVDEYFVPGELIYVYTDELCYMYNITYNPPHGR